MTAPKVTVEHTDCLTCAGTGEVPTGGHEHETGRPNVEVCSTCKGDCTVDPEWVVTCAHCQARFWLGDGCEHDTDRCADCREGCSLCQQDAGFAAAYDMYREFQLMGEAS